MLNITFTVDEINYKKTLEALKPLMAKAAEQTSQSSPLTRALKSGDGAVKGLALALSLMPPAKRDAFVAEAANAASSELSALLTELLCKNGADLTIRSIAFEPASDK